MLFRYLPRESHDHPSNLPRIERMRKPSIRNPRSIWDVFFVGGVFLLSGYVLLQLVADFTVRRELVVVAIIVALWMVWAVLHVIKESGNS